PIQLRHPPGGLIYLAPCGVSAMVPAWLDGTHGACHGEGARQGTPCVPTLNVPPCTWGQDALAASCKLNPCGAPAGVARRLRGLGGCNADQLRPFGHLVARRVQQLLHYTIGRGGDGVLH